MSIETAEHRCFGMDEAIPAAYRLHVLIAEESRRLGLVHHPVPLPDSVSDEHETFAYVNHGRWVVDCPFCGSAQHAAKTDHRFLCSECGNAEARGAWLPVRWPRDAKKIEQVLDERPREANRNWRPPEKLSVLKSENKAMMPS